jgi:hypothetical protein
MMALIFIGIVLNLMMLFVFTRVSVKQGPITEPTAAAD